MAMSTLWQEALPGTESQMGRLKSLEELVERRESKAEVPRVSMRAHPAHACCILR